MSIFIEPHKNNEWPCHLYPGEDMPTFLNRDAVELFLLEGQKMGYIKKCSELQPSWFPTFTGRIHYPLCKSDRFRTENTRSLSSKYSGKIFHGCRVDCPAYYPIEKAQREETRNRLKANIKEFLLPFTSWIRGLLDDVWVKRLIVIAFIMHAFPEFYDAIKDLIANLK